MDITELADELARKFDITPESAKETAEIYLKQIEDIDRRTIDRDDIGDDDAETVIEVTQAAIEAGDIGDDDLASDLIEISERIRDRQAELDDLTDRRNKIVNRLLDRANSVKDICGWSGLSRARVYAIRDAR